MKDLPKETEDRYTQASAWCSRPDLWHSIDDSSPEEEVLVFIAGLVRMMKPTFVLVANSGMGRAVEAIGVALSHNNHGMVCWIEPDKKLRELTKDQCNYLSRVEFWETTRGWEDDPWKADLLFIDGCPPKRTLRDLKDKLAEGAVVLFHDTAPGALADQIMDLEVERAIECVWTFATPRGFTMARVR